MTWSEMSYNRFNEYEQCGLYDDTYEIDSVYYKEYWDEKE